MITNVELLSAAAEASTLPTGWIATLLAVLAGLGGVGGVTALLLVRTQKRKLLADSGKTDAEADSIMADAQTKRVDREARVLDMYDRGMQSMQERLDDAEEKIDRLTTYIEILVQALRAGGQPVPPMPPKMAADAHQGQQDRESGARPFLRD